MKEEPEIGMVPFVTETYFDNASKLMQKGIFVDGELFDWSANEDEYNEAMKYAAKFDKIKRKEIELKIEKSIEEHFLQSFSEFMGRQVTLEEINTARTTGWIKN